MHLSMNLIFSLYVWVKMPPSKCEPGHILYEMPQGQYFLHNSILLKHILNRSLGLPENDRRMCCSIDSNVNLKKVDLQKFPEYH